MVVRLPYFAEFGRDKLRQIGWNYTYIVCNEMQDKESASQYTIIVTFIISQDDYGTAKAALKTANSRNAKHCAASQQ